MSILSTAFDSGRRGRKTLRCGGGILRIGDRVQIHQMLGLSSHSWQGDLQSIGSAFCTVAGVTVPVCTISPLGN